MQTILWWLLSTSKYLLIVWAIINYLFVKLNLDYLTLTVSVKIFFMYF